VTIDDWQALGIVCGALVALMTVVVLGWSFMRWLWRLGRKFDEVLCEVRSIRPAMRDEIHGHEHRWHGETPPSAPIPTWVQPRPNGTGPGVHRAERWY
jgi:hypothetical protein